MGRITEIDFFEAPGRREVERAREAVEERTASGRARRPGGPAPRSRHAQRPALVTRPRPHVDRIASAWLIKRFVDPEAEFVFVARSDSRRRDPVRRGRRGLRASRRGLHVRDPPAPHRLRDRKLAILAEIVHEADIKDQKFARDEARGIDLVLRALLSAIKDDHEALAQGMTLFDGLYATVGERT
jgi:hypothetical protein